ncbi:hypothetical protein [Hydrogenophaga sp.]|uniref:hypothetical protein n=1 Tax=Hydrogenophaga sp. TaxID=1904254 RepID=UPI002730B80F|nr:hypothetical protein [Hydrogenophaga sp.]MDP2016312.1 hypothetical protein [Hydrogenophaga sp.]MDP3166523.1 hypothetical protein [Hydrogenophaga sp.]
MVQTQAKVVAPRTTVPVQAVLTVKSGLVGHVLVAAKSGQLYAVTPKAAGADWDKLQLGQTMELRVTEEPLPQVVSARIVTPE